MKLQPKSWYFASYVEAVLENLIGDWISLEIDIVFVFYLYFKKLFNHFLFKLFYMYVLFMFRYTDLLPI